MKKIFKKPQTGKTTELIKESASTGYYIVCHNTEEAIRIRTMATELKLNIPFPLTHNEFINKQYYGKGIKGFLIDNADYLLQYLTTVPIKTITISI